MKLKFDDDEDELSSDDTFRIRRRFCDSKKTIDYMTTTRTTT